jgi:cytochrome c oxidase subunit 1
MGGMTGVMLASIPMDLQAHDTFFVVAHFHYVLIGGALFPLFGAFHFWFPKLTGRMIDERLGKIAFWILFVGFNLTFFPMHILGLYGMTRRIYTYPADMGWGPMNMTATVGAFLIALGGIVFILNVTGSLKHGPVAGTDPWEAGTLEWATDSPPAPYNFLHLPLVTDRYPLWAEAAPERGYVTGMRNDRREVLITTILDAAPHHRSVLPPSSIWPFLTAGGLTLGLVGSVAAFSWYYVASVLGLIGFIGWFWPREPLEITP